MAHVKKHIFSFSVLIIGLIISLIVSMALYDLAVRRTSSENQLLERAFKNGIDQQWRIEEFNVVTIAQFFKDTRFVSKDEFKVLAARAFKQSNAFDSISWWALKGNGRDQSAIQPYKVYQYQNEVYNNDLSDVQNIVMDAVRVISSDKNDIKIMPTYLIRRINGSGLIVADIAVVIQSKKAIKGILFARFNVTRFIDDIESQYRHYGVQNDQLEVNVNYNNKHFLQRGFASDGLTVEVKANSELLQVEWIYIIAIFIICSFLSIVLAIFIIIYTERYKRIRQSTQEKAASFDEEVRKRALAQKRLEVYQNFLEKLVDERTRELKDTNEYLTANQTKLIESEKMASLGLMAAGVAHEINNPMGFVKSNNQSLSEMVQMLRAIIPLLEAYFLSDDHNDRSALFERIRHQCKTMQLDVLLTDMEDMLKENEEGIGRIQEIVSSLRTFLYEGESQMRSENIVEIIGKSIKVASVSFKNKDITIKQHYDYKGLVECYPNRLSQVIVNMLNNSADSIEMHRGIIQIRVWSEKEKVYIEIEDNGKGMSQETRKNIFTPFYTTKKIGAGLGLGMYVSYTIIQRHQGTIEVKSVEGKGTTFIIALPIKQE